MLILEKRLAILEERKTMKKRTTLQEVAQAVGVSVGTVHKALYDKPGVSSCVRAEILRQAQELGYKTPRPNLSLRKAPVHIAVAFPALQGENAFFYSELYKGYQDCLSDLGPYPLQITELSYQGDADQCFAAQMKSLLRRTDGHVDGLLTGGRIFQRDYAFLKRLALGGLAVVLVGDEVPDVPCLCSVKTDFRLEGMLAAEILTSRIPAGKKMLVCTGDSGLPSNRESAAGFEEYLRENGCKHPLYKLAGYEAGDNLYERAIDVLAADPEVRGLYSVNLRNSLLLARAVEQQGLAGAVSLVGSDLCPASAQYLRRELFANIITKQPRQQGRIGAKRLTDYLLHGRLPAEKTECLKSAVIFRSNLGQYEPDI